MPCCSSPLHTTSPYPRLLLQEHFYVSPRGGVLGECRHCRRVRSMLRRLYGTRHVPTATLRATWAMYQHIQAQHAKRHGAPPGERWCSHGHYAPLQAFSAKRKGYCRACEAIASIAARARRLGRPCTWDQAATRHFCGRLAVIRRRNKLAPLGQRWCSRHDGYYVLPAHWRTWKGNQLGYCPDCRRTLAREFKRRKRLEQLAAAAD